MSVLLKKRYFSPTIEKFEFFTTDVIRTSNLGEEDFM